MILIKNNLGRRYTGESSEYSTPTELGRCFTFTSSQRTLRNDEQKPCVNKNTSDILDVSLIKFYSKKINLFYKKLKKFIKI